MIRPKDVGDVLFRQASVSARLRTASHPWLAARSDMQQLSDESEPSFGIVDAASQRRLALRPASSIALIGLLTAVWANLHGSYVLVPILLLAATLGAWPGAAPPRSVRDHAVALVVSVAAPIANPYGVRIYTLLGPYVRSLFAAVGLLPAQAGLTVSEWTPTWRAMT